MAEMKMIVGLGNPGASYVDTRHNAGFKVVESLSTKLDIGLGKKRFGGCLGIGEFGDKKLILLKPLRYMNRSGEVIVKAAGFYKVSLCDLLIVTDDMAFEPGRIRLRAKGSAGGHNGLADVIEKLGTNEFGRLRIGVGKSDLRPSRDYVLSEPDEHEKQLLNEAILRASDAALFWAEYGVVKAMNEFNPA